MEDLKMAAVMLKSGQQVNIKTRMPIAEIRREYHGTDLARPWAEFIGLNEHNDVVTIILERDLFAGIMVGPLPTKSDLAIPAGLRLQ